MEGKGKMSNLEALMTELMRASVVLKRALYRRDEAASTAPEGTDGPTMPVHTCLVCERSAAGAGAQVRHKPNCALLRLQQAQKALREASPELFTPGPVPDEAAPLAASGRSQSGQEIRVRAECKYGELLAEMPKNRGTTLMGRDPGGNHRQSPDVTADTLSSLGISKLQSFEWQKRATVPEPG